MMKKSYFGHQDQNQNQTATLCWQWKHFTNLFVNILDDVHRLLDLKPKISYYSTGPASLSKAPIIMIWWMMISLPAPEPRQSDTPGAADPHHAMLVSGELELVWSQHHGYINVFIRTPVLCWTPTQAWVGYVVSLIISQTSILYLYCPARSSDTYSINCHYLQIQ